ncbi:hypothetical protein [Actinocorallia libanotica]|uniref:Uncharacterized protein n=1 Tax=Actinocorallia libanotica TaxID=46162 RepID=A0ABN1RD98_9ACTN
MAWSTFSLVLTVGALLVPVVLTAALRPARPARARRRGEPGGLRARDAPRGG